MFFLPSFSKCAPLDREGRTYPAQNTGLSPSYAGKQTAFPKKESRSTSQYAADFFHPEKTSPPSICPKVT